MDVFHDSQNCGHIFCDYANVMGVHMDKVHLMIPDEASIPGLLGLPLEMVSKLNLREEEWRGILCFLHVYLFLADLY